MTDQTKENSAGSTQVRVDCALGAWQPIDTAPKDGTIVLLKNMNNGLEDTGCWCDYTKLPVITGIEGEWCQDLGNGDMTHWMPLPAPPV